MRRQLLAIAAAVTTTAAVAFAVPAFADGEEPTRFEGETFCEDLLLDDLQLVFLGGVDFDEPLPTAIDDLGEFVDLDLPIVAVIVQGDPDANLYLEPPFDDLVAPDGEGIIFIEVCGFEEEEPPPTEEPTEPPTDKPTEPVDTPAPVPTEVPAGTNAGDRDSRGLWGLIAASSVAVAGAAILTRRRFLHDS
jgi:outer membrane biosynthesis protein TonB